MDFSELLTSVRDAAVRAWGRTMFLVRSHWVVATVLFLGIGGGLVWWASTGFSLELGRSRAGINPLKIITFVVFPATRLNELIVRSTIDAVTQPQCFLRNLTSNVVVDVITTVTLPGIATKWAIDTTVGLAAAEGVTLELTCNADGTSAKARTALQKAVGQLGGAVPGTAPAPGAAPAPGGGSSPAQPQTGTPIDCEPVKPADDWKPPANAKIVNGKAVTAAGKPYCTPPAADVSFPVCFSVDYTDYKKEYSNFADLNAIGNPLNLVTKHGDRVKVVGYRGMYKNLCPWTVHYSFRSIGSKKAGGDPGGSDMTQATEIAFDRTLPGGSQDAQSCWNNGKTFSCEKEFPHEILYTINTFTCGRVFAGAGWDHFISGGGPGPLGNPGFAVVFNYGRDCTGSATERAPGSVTTKPGTGAVGAGTCPASPTASQVRPAQLTVQCGTTQNVLTWQDPKTLNAASNSVLRTEKPPGGEETSKFVFSEGGCWNALRTSTYTDRDVKPGVSYTYRIKTHPNVASNSVTCLNGASVVPSPGATIPTLTPGATPIGATPVPTAVITPPLSGTQLQCAPLSQTVAIGQPAVVQAFGGGGGAAGYSFGVSPDGQVIDGEADRATVRYAKAGPQTVTVSDGQSTVQCVVNVTTALVPTPVPTPYTIPTPTGGAGAGGAGTVPTGPGETTLLALIVSVAVSLLYVSYTHSPLARRHEAEKMSADQGPMDFRS